MNNGVISKIYDAFKSQRFPNLILFLCLSLLLPSCLEVKQAININRDGSGLAKMEIAIQNEMLSMPGGQQQISGMKAALQKEGWSIEGDKDVNGKHLITASKKFKDITELNDNETRYAFSSEKKGFMKKAYSLELTQLKSSEMPFPYEVSIKMPGSIDETNGTKVSSGEVKWTLQGMRRGTKLSVKSSGLALPDFASLKDVFNRVFNFLFYREAIVFLRDGNLWVMDSDGKNQRQLTKEGVGSFSVSRDGKKVVYVDKDDNFGDVHVISLEDDSYQKLTASSDCAFPVISPNGTDVAFVKVDERFNGAKNEENIIGGVWSAAEGTTFEYAKEGTAKRTGIYIMDITTGQQKKNCGCIAALCDA